MKHQVACGALLAWVACGGSPDDYMVVPGGGTHPGSGSSAPDASVADAGSGSGSALVGRVCLVSDPRQLTACAGSGASGMIVTLGSASATTADDGGFALVPRDGSAQWQVSGAAIETSIMPRTGGLEIPAISTTVYDAMVANTGSSLLGAGQGAILARVRKAGAPVSGAVVTSGPAISDIYYDAATPTVWSNDQTAGAGAFGTFWIPVEPAGLTSLTVSPPGGGSAVTVTAIPIVDQALTFFDVGVP